MVQELCYWEDIASSDLEKLDLWILGVMAMTNRRDISE